MKSTLVRSFEKVFETSLGKRLGKRLGKVLGKTLRCHVLCLIVFCMAVGCADEVSEPNYIVSPYTEQTMEFFERSGSDVWGNVLETVQIDGERCILKKQTQCLSIYLNKYTLETVPEHLAQGIEFSTLRIVPHMKSTVAHFDPAVLERVLKLFGTICADTLIFYNLGFDDSRIKKKSQRMARLSGKFGRSETPEVAPPTTRCTLSIKTLVIQHNTTPAINWLQKRLDLSHCLINLKITGKLELENLELLDGFNARSIEALTLDDFKRLASLECKLFREGPLPDKLVISTPRPIYPKISEEIAGNIISKEWRLLVVPMPLWKELMKPSELPKHFTAVELRVTLCVNTPSPFPVMGISRATVTHLTIMFEEHNNLLTRTDLEQTLEWVSKDFEGLRVLQVEAVGEPTLRKFVRTYTFNINTITNLVPTLTGIWVCGIDCMHIPHGSNILCLSLEAWELYRSGKLADELANSQTDLSVLSPEQQAKLTSQEELAADNEACCVCLCTAADLRSSSPDTQISILDHPKHSVCCRCLDGMVKARGTVGPIMCPVCRQEHMLPLVKNVIERDSLGRVEVTPN
ncbi:hypothetical protein NEDG_02257 [Nematocida displodere]|uniref:Uncharacterized protein n=1 Tax=Nematocida displodere TaxID=1805483 RepID=A0A177EJV8_9MICR|nr:hypothetical protein NEDG_02257 [Nematocida displodere]